MTAVDGPPVDTANVAVRCSSNAHFMKSLTTVDTFHSDLRSSGVVTRLID